MTSYRIETIRLVNFHNFVDETIAIRDGGHLFLLGDNGSGKTTVLDAVHYVLAAGELELNAAARIGGRRDDGRSLQGIVLRHDFERGVRNEGGAIAYAAIELCDPASGKRLSLGIGTEATTMDARLVRWAFLAARPLSEIVLVDPAGVPLDREALRTTLGGSHVFAQLAGYRKELTRRLFGSERQYDDAVRFWGMAKAYREIVAGARDFGALFTRLLPAPDTGVFDEILRTLRAIDDLEVALRDLDDQAGYMRGLVELVREVASARETAARYRWLACVREREEERTSADRAFSEAACGRDDAKRLRADAEAARLRSERLAESLRRAEADDTAGVLGAVREAERRHAELATDVERARIDHESARRAHEAAHRMTAEREEIVATLASELASELRAAASAASELPGDLGAVFALGDALDRIRAGRGSRPDGGTLDGAEADQIPLPDPAGAESAVTALAGRTAAAAVDARVGALTAETARTAAVHALAELDAVAELGPVVADHAAARRALEDAGIPAAAVYELLEPAAGAEPTVIAAIEALAGDAVLGAFLVGDDEQERARTVVAAIAPAVRIVTVTDDSATLPAWCASLFDVRDGRALHVLAAELAQSPAFGEVAPPSADGDLVLRGLAFRATAGDPQLLGVEARRRVRAARLDAARARMREADAAAARANEHVAAAQAMIARVGRLERAIRAVGGGELARAWHDAAAAGHRLELAARVLVNAESRARELQSRLAAVDTDLAALRARVAGVDLDGLERRLAALRQACASARAEWEVAIGDVKRAEVATQLAEDRARAARARAGELDALVAEADAVLRRCLVAIDPELAAASEDELARYVRVTQRGDSFRSIETLRQRIADVERQAESAADELERDGSRGVRYLAYASRFGLVYDRAANQIEDRRGQPLAGVLAELERSIGEQRSVVNERTRTLMDTLVMGELARHLQGQIHHLHETIKGINRVLRGLKFGASEYQFQVSPRPDRAELVELVRRLSILDEDSRTQFRAWIDARLEELRADDDEAVPALLDYRQWFDFKLRMSTTDAEGIELTHRLRQVGSGGEQGVPNYLLVLSIAKLMFDAAGAAVRPLLFDEAFYGIDAGRRDQLLRLATDLGLQLFVASPDQDGATTAVRAATTLFVVKDDNHDIHLAPYHFWNHARDAQPGLFAPPADPVEAAECRTS